MHVSWQGHLAGAVQWRWSSPSGPIMVWWWLLVPATAARRRRAGSDAVPQLKVDCLPSMRTHIPARLCIHTCRVPCHIITACLSAVYTPVYAGRTTPQHVCQPGIVDCSADDGPCLFGCYVQASYHAYLESFRRTSFWTVESM